MTSRNSRCFSAYYSARLPFIGKTISLFPGKVDGHWASFCAGTGLPLSYSLAAGKVLLKPVNSYLSRKGKMLRSLLSCLVLEAGGKDPSAFAPLVSMMEIMESDTIMIDDMIDASPSRRGGASAHVLYGCERTMLSSGMFYYGCWNIFSRDFLPVTPRQERKALEWFVKRHLLTSVGQTEEIYYRRLRRLLSEKRYFQEISSRISVLSFGGPLYLAGLAAGFTDRRLKILDELGDYSGLAYHLHGDELNLFPRSAEWGKEKGDDIISGTMTYILSAAFRKLGRRDSAFLKKCLGRKGLERRELEKAIGLIKASGAVEENRKAVDRLCLRCSELIRALRFPEKYEKLLEGALGYMAYERKK